MKENLPVSLQKLIHKVEETFAEDPAMVELFINCFSNTLDTTVKKMEDGTTHVITGDIPAMWLRDSVAQVRPYLVAAAEDQEISDLLAGLSRRQFFFVNHDPYANAFNQEENGNCWDHDETEMSDWLWERKYEIDSLCYPVQFAYLLWKNTGRTDHFDDNFVKGLHTILNVWKTEQYHEEKSPYSFQRKGCYFTDTLSREGKGALVKSGVGLTWSGFRPSDDACIYGYLIPSNMFATVVLGYMETIAHEVLKDEALAAEAASLKKEIHDAIESMAIVDNYYYGRVYAYEVDGYGQYMLMDDANVPSEVARPGTFTISNEKVNLLEALAMAGDMTVWGVRDNVKLIRESADGKQEIITLDLNSAETILSPYYWLQQNDIVYVTPNKAKARNSDIGNSTSLWFSATSILVSLASLLVTIFR